MDFVALVNNFCKLVDFLDGLFVLLIEFLDNLERPMLLAKDPVRAVAFHALNLHEVVPAPSTLYMEGNEALCMLALYTGAIIFSSTNDTLQVESLVVKFIHAHWRFGRNYWSWNPHCARQVYPLVQCLSVWRLARLEQRLVSLQEKNVVLGNFCERLRLQEVQLQSLLGEKVAS